MSIALRLREVQTGIREACAAAGRDPDEVRLVAVSKTFPAAAVREAYEAGQRDFGENYAQELRDKARDLADLPGIRWHFIGRNHQANKAKYVAPVAFRVHAIEAIEEARALVGKAPGPLACLVAVNVGGEETKGGAPPEVTLELCERLHQEPGVELRGLMCLPPFREDPAQVAPFFERLAALAAAGRDRGLPLTELSMGMSHDYPVAIRHGATWVRVGSAIFGAR